MAGERLSEATQLEMRVSDGARQRSSNKKAGYSGRGGKLRLPRPVITKKKPYDRPLPPGALDLPLSSGHLGPAPPLPVRLVGSASNLITSSASYLFDSFFKRRRTLWIGNGVRRTAGTDSADMEHKEDQDKEEESPLQGPAQVTHAEKVEGKDLDLALVEQILKQQFLSREEVKRLTDVLEARAHGGDAVGSVTESQKMIKQVGEDPSPVQLAKAYMGKRTSLSTSLIPQWQSTPDRYGAVVAGTSLGGRIKEDAFERSLAAQSSRAYPASAAASVRMLKRRLIADDEYTVTPRGPTRRVRQKMTIVASSSPYIRQVTAATGPLGTLSTPLLQASEKTEKIMEALQEPMFASKGKSVEEPMVMAGPSHNQYRPESSKARETVENHSKEEFTGLPTSGEPGVSSYKPAVATAAPEPLEKSVAGSLAASPLEPPVFIPEKPKGFHMNAFFEDSSSDEEASPPVKALMSSEAQQARPLISRAGTEQPFATTLAVEKSTPMLPSMKACPLISHVPFVTEEESPPSTVLSVLTMTPPISAGLSVLPSLPAAAPAAISLPVLEAGTVAGAIEPSSVGAIEPSSVGAIEPSVAAGLAAEASDASLATSFQPPSEPSSSATRVAEAPISVAPCFTALAAPVTASQLPSATRVAEAPISVAPSLTALAAVSKVQSTLVTSVTSVSPVGSVALMTVPATVPVVTEAGVESPNADKQVEQDAMATEPMTEEPDSSIMCSAAPSFLFGSAPTVASTTIGQTLSFGSGATSASFSFPVQSSTSSAVSSSVQFPFGSQSSSAAGQSFTFGASGSASFSGSTESSFPFGSSAATSVSSKFPATSSAPMTFPATPATPAAPSSFSFGAPATSSSLANSTSLFGSQTTPIASSFAGTRAPAFTFSAPPTSSGTPTPPSFQFGGAGAGASSMASSPSFGGQPFTFGGQPTVAAANPFAQSGASSAAPFQFASSQPVFSSGASTTSTFSFGAQPAASPFPFTFGGQPGASPTGQPFGFGGQPGASPTGQPLGFGGQPAAPAQSSFTLPGSTPFGSAGASGMDFGGGFSLGAAGGEKSGRKFIKAKRIGGVKRGK